MLRTLCGIALFVGKYMDDYSNYRFVKKVTDLSQVQYNNHLIETVCFFAVDDTFIILCNEGETQKVF